MKSAILVVCFIAFAQIVKAQATDEFFEVRIIDGQVERNPAESDWNYTISATKEVDVVYLWQDDGTCEVADWWVTTRDVITTSCRVIGTGKLTLRVKGVGTDFTDLVVRVAKNQIRLRLTVAAKAN